jgi:hypothetical protein
VTNIVSRFATWQVRRRRLCHAWLKNDMLNTIMDAVNLDDPRSCLEPEDWDAKMSRWFTAISRATELIQSSMTELSPARWFEHDAWSLLSNKERDDAAVVLESEWLTMCRLGRRQIYAHAAARRSKHALDKLTAALSSGTDPDLLRTALLSLEHRVRKLHGALKSFDFPPVFWNFTAECS